MIQTLACRQQDADMLTGTGGSIPFHRFMSPRTIMRLVGVGGFARLMLG